jgi:hypothetical protein
MKMNNNSKDEIKEEKAGMELMPENLDKVSGGTSNEAEEENKKRKRRVEQEEVGKKRKP